MVYFSDLPLTHPNSVAHYLISKVAREHGVIVLLSGEGADELFGGYSWNYRRKRMLLRLQPLLRRVPAKAYDWLASRSSRNGRPRSSRRTRRADLGRPRPLCRRMVWGPGARALARDPIGSGRAQALLDLMAAYFVWQGALYGRARFGTLASSLVVHTLLKLVGIVLLAVLGLSVTGAILAQVAASIGVLGYLLAIVPPARTMPAAELARPMLIMALPLSLYAMASQIHVNLGLWLLSAAGTAGDALGFFVAALKQPHFDGRTGRAVGGGLRFDVAGACPAGRGDSTAPFEGGGALRASADRLRGDAP